MSATWERECSERVTCSRNSPESSFKVEFFMSPRDGAPWELVQSAHYRRNSASESAG